MARQQNFTILEWVILLGLIASAIAVSELIGLAHQWEDGVVYTVAVFAVVATALRPVWGRATFWRSLALIFTLHVVIVLVAIQALPSWRFGIPKLLLIPIGGAEGVLIAVVLRKRMARLRR
jgi:anti-sigma-K factor RskA